jgi:hypothetical protein
VSELSQAQVETYRSSMVLGFRVYLHSASLDPCSTSFSMFQQHSSRTQFSFLITPWYRCNPILLQAKLAQINCFLSGGGEGYSLALGGVEGDTGGGCEWISMLTAPLLMMIT